MADDPLHYFRIEARDIVEQLGKGMLELEKDAPGPELVPRMLRLAHTLKGAARVVKQPAIADQLHAIEGVLEPFRAGGDALPRDRVDAMLAMLDVIGRRVAALDQVEQGPTTTALPERRAEVLAPPRPAAEDIDDLLLGLGEAHGQLATLRAGLAAVEHMRRTAEQLGEQLQRSRSPGAHALVAGKSASLAEELRSRLSTLERTVTPCAEQIERELRQVREKAERLRLVPAASMFTSLERAARDAAHALQKRVSFEAQGGGIRIEARALASVQGALVQAIRNAVAHGIEPHSERLGAGKPSEGHVSVEVLRRGDRICFACTDDGRGVDIDAVRRAAQRRGLLTSDARALGVEQLLRLLLDGGLSTSTTVTEISGRGIGLDVVRDAAATLGGTASVRTGAASGTTVEIAIPASLSSIDALLVESAERVAAIPLDAVKSAIQLDSADLVRAPAGDTLVVGGRVLPFLPLRRPLRAPPQRGERRRLTAVVIEGGGAAVALGVDRLLGTANVVVRPLPPLMPVDAVVAGAALDAEGNPQMVLRPEALVAAAGHAVAEPEAPRAPRTRILVIDDSLTTRMLEQSILESAGYDVDLASSAEEGLERARRQRYALFLVDVEMPGMDGFGFIAQTRADPELRSVPAFLVTSRASADDRARGEAVGARAYIVKSEFDQGALLSRIAELVR